MSNFIMKLEDMLRTSGHEDDWEIRYLPAESAYVLTLDGDVILMRRITTIEGRS